MGNLEGILCSVAIQIFTFNQEFDQLGRILFAINNSQNADEKFLETKVNNSTSVLTNEEHS